MQWQTWTPLPESSPHSPQPEKGRGSDEGMNTAVQNDTRVVPVTAALAAMTGRGDNPQGRQQTGGYRCGAHTHWDHVPSVTSDSARPRALYPPGSCVHGVPQVRTLQWGPRPAPGDLPTQVSNPHLLCLLLAGGFFTTSVPWEGGRGGETGRESAVSRIKPEYTMCITQSLCCMPETNTIL